MYRACEMRQSSNDCICRSLLGCEWQSKCGILSEAFLACSNSKHYHWLLTDS